ncbi:hypothetical protein C8J56DRAFT_914646 [Mycena floridula]|nr:hypothetical protein C8J56DRAFT_914646 [Mycena floridula]
MTWTSSTTAIGGKLMPAHNLPPELLHYIIRYLAATTPGDNSTLFTCSLVCKAWTTWTRPCLFSVLKISANSTWKSCADMLAHPKGTIPLSLIHGLQLSSHHIDIDIVKAVNKLTGRKITRLVIKAILRRSSQSRIALEDRVAFSRLTHLQIEDPSFSSISYVDMAGFIQSLPRIRSLVLSGIAIVEQVRPFVIPIPATSLVLPPSLRHLTLERVKGFMPAMFNAPQIVKLSSLTLAWPCKMGSVETLNQFLAQNCLKSLTSITFKDQAAHDVRVPFGDIDLGHLQKLRSVRLIRMPGAISGHTGDIGAFVDSPRPVRDPGWSDISTFLTSLQSLRSKRLRRIHLDFSCFQVSTALVSSFHDALFDQIGEIMAAPGFSRVKRLEIRLREALSEAHAEKVQGFSSQVLRIVRSQI